MVYPFADSLRSNPPFASVASPARLSPNAPLGDPVASREDVGIPNGIRDWDTGGFNHLETYESQWEGLSHIIPIYYGK